MGKEREIDEPRFAGVDIMLKSLTIDTIRIVQIRDRTRLTGDERAGKVKYKLKKFVMRKMRMLNAI